MEHSMILLKKKGEKIPAQVYLMARVENKKYLYYTRERIAPEDWTGKRMKKSRNGHRKVNEALIRVEQVFYKSYKELENKKKLTRENLKKLMEYTLGRMKKEDYMESGNMFDFFDEALLIMKQRGKKILPYESAIKKLKEFNSNLTWEDINAKTYSNWLDFMQNHPTRPLSKNSIAAYTTYMKRLFNMAFEEGVYEFSPRDLKAWRHGTEITTQISITPEEINGLMNLELEGNTADARDLFVIGCCTGLRAGNYRNINPERDIKDGILHILTNKTGELANFLNTDER